MKYIIPLDKCSTEKASVVGGKAIGLGFLLGLGCNVPSGFVVSTDAFYDYLKRNHIYEYISKIKERLSIETRLESEIRSLFSINTDKNFWNSLLEELQIAYDKLGENPLPLVAVRSSANVEDAEKASFAGQHESFLGKRGTFAILESVISCWLSLFSARAISYRSKFNISDETVAMAVVIQEMVTADTSGVMVSIDPLTGDPSQIYIEACYGLGTGVVNSEVTPDRFSVDKVTLEIRQRTIGDKKSAHYLDSSTGSIFLKELSRNDAINSCLENDDIVRLARICKKIEKAAGSGQEIEWALRGKDDEGLRKLYVLQSRPETVWSSKPLKPASYKLKSYMDEITMRIRSSDKDDH